MIKKFLCAVTFIALVLNLSGCTSKNAETDTATEKVQQKVDFIVSEPPVNAREGVKDPTTGYVKINPSFIEDESVLNSKKPVEWVKDGLGANIPPIDEGCVLEVVNTDDQFLAYVANTTEDSFRKYFEKLVANGYQYGDISTWESFNLYNDKYEVNMRYHQDGGTVTTIRAKLKK